jgi:V-type H+-transporting ATPase subunit a
MGIFAFYNGFVYNEFFAIPLEIFGSCYSEEIVVVSNQPIPNAVDQYNPKEYGFERRKIDGEPCVYEFGMDPRWF